VRGKLGKSEHQKTTATLYERKLAKELGGQAVVGSGAFECAKGDVKTKDFLFDSKQTAAKSITLSTTILTKITREAVQEGKYPGIIATVGETPFGVSPAWAVIPLPVFTEILNELNKLKGL
jgi:hypothetical protein